MTTPIGIDTGGTFTDIIWLGADGRLRIHKQPATPDDPSRAIADGLAAIAGQSGAGQSGAPPPDVPIIHGSTVATNALLERRGARTALIATAGFGDVLEIGRQNRPDIYALLPQKPPPLVPRAWRVEAAERVTAAGEVLRPLHEAALARELARLAAEGIESVAVCFLFSFLHPDHERRAGELARAALGPDVHVSLSVDVLPEYREFERAAATVINAYVAPLMSRYLARLARRVAPRRLAIMQSNGGIISATTAGAQAARTALSGPAGGVVGAMWVADGAGEGGKGGKGEGEKGGKGEGELAPRPGAPAPLLPFSPSHVAGGKWQVAGGKEGERGRKGAGEKGESAPHLDAPDPLHPFAPSHVDYANIITFDMGGTSTDVALCPGRVPMTTEGEIAGLPLRLPLIDIHTVGAGGGSLAYVDAGGALLVGPQSAGADPGPAAYHADYDGWRAALDTHFQPGRATVSDANLVLGRLDAGHFLGGGMALHEASARRALAALAADLGVASADYTAANDASADDTAAEEAAWAVVRVANANMERAVRRISVERGHDPRRFTLVAFGGGGPLHAAELAAGLRVPRVLVPPTPGVLSALGMLAADPTRDTSRTVMLPAAGDSAAELAAVFAELQERARAEMADDGYDPAALRLTAALDARYVGQSHELTIPAAPEPDAAAVFHATAAFHDAHAARYGYARPDAPVEFVTARLTITAPSAFPALPRPERTGRDASPALVGRKPVWFGGGFVAADLYDRDRLRAGNAFAGPAIVYQYDATTVVPPGWVARVDDRGNLMMEGRETTDFTE